MTNAQLAASLAQYLHRRIASEAPAPAGGAARLYGVEVRDSDGVVDDQDGAARFLCLALGPPYELVSTFGPSLTERFDAVALVVDGKAVGLDDPERRPRRVSTTTVSLPDGIGSAVTFHDAESAPIADAPVGPLAAELAAIWSGPSRNAA